MSHEALKDLLLEKQTPIIFHNLRAQTHISFSVTQLVAPTSIRHFLQLDLIVGYTKDLAERAGPVNKDYADGYLAREILLTGMTLAAILYKCKPYLTVFLTSVASLNGRILVQADAIALEKKGRSSFYEKNLQFIEMAPTTSEKLLKRIS